MPKDGKCFPLNVLPGFQSLFRITKTEKHSNIKELEIIAAKQETNSVSAERETEFESCFPVPSVSWPLIGEQH